MAEVYTNPHSLPPTQCPANVATFTDNPVVIDVTGIRKVHIDELRTYINGELTRRGLDTITFTDTITANVTGIRAVHVNELQDAIQKIQTGDCAADIYYCPEDTVGTITFTNEPIVANTNKVADVDINEPYTDISALMTSCICESEQCEYCADCGYKYSYCNHNGVACNNRCGAEGGCGQTVYANSCASINLIAGTPHPYKTASSVSVHSAWDGTVPWYMGEPDRPAAAWKSWTYYNPPGGGAPDHSDWNCKCNPYTWTT